jgi:Putative prokaryotic signal transducing protein
MEEDQPTKPLPLDYQSDRPLNLVILARMSLFEAELAKGKLESEGVDCIIRDASSAVTNPLVVTGVPLLVRDTDLERAKQILAQVVPPLEDDVGDEDAYVDEDFRCPKCHRKAVDLLPLSRGKRRVRMGCLTLLLLPIFVAIVERIISDSRISRQIAGFVDAATLPWMIVLVAFSVVVLLFRRKKRCRECGYEWEKTSG